MTEDPLKDEKKDENPADPKKILAELDKKAAEPPVSSPPEPPAELPQGLAEPAPLVTAQPAVTADPIDPSLPLISDAMRRLDELLARFRGSS